MTNKDKQLLLADLCARLVYGVILNITLKNKYDKIVNRDIELTDDNLTYIIRDSHWIMFKPYLRPMLSMTEEEYKEYSKLWNLQDEFPTDADIRFKIDVFDWLNAHHFDYRGLIEKGLALEAPEGTYKQ